MNNERNGLLLYETIEKAFDCKQLCFFCILHSLYGTLYVKILCDDLRKTFIVDDQTRMRTNESRTFYDIDIGVFHLSLNFSHTDDY